MSKASLALWLSALWMALPVLAGGPPAARPQTVALGQPLPDVTMLGLNVPDKPLSLYFGRKLIINVWASWCGPCRAEAASLERFTWSDGGAPYTVIGISTDDDRRAAQEWLRRSKATLPHFIDRAVLLETLLGARTIPMTVLVDERGRVVARFAGAREWDTPESLQLVQAAFQQAAAGRLKSAR